MILYYDVLNNETINDMERNVPVTKAKGCQNNEDVDGGRQGKVQTIVS